MTGIDSDSREFSAPPPRIELESMVLRRWRAEDAPAFKAALDSSLPELRLWIPWALNEPSDLTVLEERLAGYRASFDGGGDALYGVFSVGETEVLGGVGLYRRVGPGALEIGYWTRSDLAGRGIATTATRTLTEVASRMPGIERIEIRCDPANGPSMAIPRRLGYGEGPLVQAAAPSPVTGRRDLVVWTLDTAAIHRRR